MTKQRSNQTNRIDCGELESLVAVYSMGATTAEESRQIEASLGDCPEVAAALRDYQAIAAGILHLTPQRHEPPSAKVMLRGLPPREGSGAAPHAPLRLEQPRARPSNRPWILLSAASFILAIAMAAALGLYWSNEVDQLRDDQAALEARLSDQFAVLTSVGAGDAFNVELIATDDSPTDEAFATVVLNDSQGIGSLYVTGMPTLDPNMAYQLWLVRDNHTFNAGSFRVSADGSGSLIFHLSEPIESFDAMGISPEPATGSEEPTHPHLVIGMI